MLDPFPTPYAILLGDDPKMGSSLETAISEAIVNFPSLEQPFRTAISIVAIDETNAPELPDFKHGGVEYGKSFFSASLLKMGALYAAYELKRSVNNLAAESGLSTPSELFARLHADFDQLIIDKFQFILSELNISLTPEIKSTITPPKYEQIFAAIPLTSSGLALTFGSTFQTNLRGMIVDSSNNAAAECIKALGYSWINGSLHAGGFFFPQGETGIWLAGTFTGSLPVISLPSENDGKVAQATTCFDMANLYAHIFQKTLVDAGSSNEMLDYLFDSAAFGPDPSFLDFTRRGGPATNFAVTHTKIGLGPLKTGEVVASEGTIVEHISTEKKFLIVYQNSFNDENSLSAISFILERSIELFLASP